MQLLRLPEVLKKVSLSRTPLLNMVKAGTVPQPVKITDRAVAWIDEEVDQWIADRAAERGAA